MEKPLLKITFKEPIRFKIDNLSCWVNFILVKKTIRTTKFLYFHFGKYKTKTELNFDYVELSKIKSIDFIHPNEL